MGFRDLLEASPVIAAVKDEEGLRKALETDCGIVFTLYGNLCTVGDMVGKIRDAGKVPIVHMDLIQGLGSREIAVEFLRDNAGAEGIISTKISLVRHAMDLGMIGIWRTFLVDSIALNNTKKQLAAVSPDALEVLPGIMPKIVREIRSCTRVPIIAGGLLSDRADVLEALNAGAWAVSATRKNCGGCEKSALQIGANGLY